MRLRRFLSIYYAQMATHFIFLCLIEGLLYIFEVNRYLMIYLLVIGILLELIYLGQQYMKKFRYYKEMTIKLDMLDQKKDELYKKLLSIYIIGNPHKLYHEGYATYLGNLGRSLIFECQRFQSVKYSGTGNHNLENHIFKYHYFYGSNECYYVIGNELIKIEDNLNQEKYDEVLKSMEIIHENIKQIEVIRREA